MNGGNLTGVVLPVVQQFKSDVLTSVKRYAAYPAGFI